MILLLLGVAFEGVVTDPAGLGVEDAAVVFYDLRFRPVGDIGYTDAAGHFAVDLPDQLVRIRVLPNYPTTVSERWYGDTLRACQSPRIQPGVIEAIEMQLPWGGGVRGQLFRDDREPYADVALEAYPLWQDEVTVASREAVTAADGTFEITGLPPDAQSTGFLLEMGPEDAPKQFFDGGASRDDATTIDIPDGEIVDLGVIATYPGATLSGGVVSAEGPIADASVVVSTATSGSTSTDADGRWSLSGVAPGLVRITVTAVGYATTGLGDGAISTATEEVGPHDLLEDLWITLPREGRVVGQVPEIADNGSEAGGVLLVGPERSPGYIDVVDEQGAFVLQNVFPGTYTLEVWGTEGFDQLPGPLKRDGQVVTVTVEEGQEIDLGVLGVEDAARVSGTVVDDAGDAVGGAAIIVQGQGGGLRYVDFSRSDGTFDLHGLPAGTYDLQLGHGTFCEGDPTYVSIFYPSQVNPQVRRAIDLAAGEVLTWDAVMPVDHDGDGMGDAWEAANGLNRDRDDSNEDPDRDGFTNLDEYHLGTDPNEYVQKQSCGGCRAANGSVSASLLRR